MKIKIPFYIIFILSAIALTSIESAYILVIMFILCILVAIKASLKSVELSNRIDVIIGCDPQTDLKKLKAELFIYDAFKNVSMSLTFAIFCLLLKNLK